jgi:hypothetical protein
MKKVIPLIGAVILLGACTQPASDDARRQANPEKYARDRELCRAQVDEYMKTRRSVDDSRRDVFSGSPNSTGQRELPTKMDAYSDSRSSDRIVEDCMAARGYQQAPKQWWQKIGS